jgi:hypothetical protein
MKELKYQLYVGAAAEQVWDCSGLSRKSTADLLWKRHPLQLQVVGELLEYVGPGAEGEETIHVYGTLLEYHSRQSAAFYTQVPAPLISRIEKTMSHVISWKLEPAGACTKLTLIHENGIPKTLPMMPVTSSWGMILSHTKTLAETGRTSGFGS